MQRNIRIANFLSFAFHSWFWLGNWVFYYLSFGNYATVALLDSGAVMVSLLMEIPTGAFADLVGKKKTLMIAFLLQGLGAIFMGISGSFWMLAISLWLLACVGGAFYSGSLEALVYDSLKITQNENDFHKKIGVVNATRLWSMAICGLLGGLSYYIFPGLPFILNGIVCLTGLVACFWLEEPKIDTAKYTLSTFFKQNAMGIRSLFKGEYMRKLSIFLIVTGAFGIIIYNLLDDLLAVEYGYSPMGISILFSVACLIAGFASIYFPRLKIKIDERILLISSMAVMAFLLMLSPIIGMIVSGGFLFIRVILEVIYDNTASVAVNRNTESNVRTTALSSLSLLRSVPYAVGGTFLGGLVLTLGGARKFSLWFGAALLICVAISGSKLRKQAR